MKTIQQYVIVIRHGQTVPNLLLEQSIDSYYYDVTGSDETIGLTDLGFVEIQQSANFLACFLRKESTRIRKIVCSQFFRTRSTAQVIQSILPDAPPIVEDKRVAKRHYGDFWNITYLGVKALFPEEYLKFTQQGGYFYRPPLGENYVDLKERLLAFVRDEIDSTADTVCICTHSAAALMLEQLILGKLTDAELVERYDAIAVPNGRVVIYKREVSRRVFLGLPLHKFSCLKSVFGLNYSAWKPFAAYVPTSAVNCEEGPATEDLSHNDGHDSIIDKENRVA